MSQTNPNLVLILLIFATCCTCITVNALDETFPNSKSNQNDVGYHEIGRQKERELYSYISLDKNGSSDEDPEENVKRANANELSANEFGSTSWSEDIEPISDEIGNVLKRVKRCGGGGGRRRRRRRNNNNNDDDDDDDDGDANRSRRSRRARRRRARRARARKARKTRNRAKKSSTVTTTITTRIKRAADSQDELLETDTDEKVEQSITVSTGYKHIDAGETGNHPLASRFS